MSFPPSLPIPPEVLRIAETLEAAGFETWCVGGAVRDNLLDLENKDFDLATAARPEDVRQLFRRSIPVGIEHGTVAVLDHHKQPHEVTTFRRDVVTDGRHAVVEFGVSLDDDLARRDFTINAIAYHPLRHEWRDPFDGRADLERRVVRAVGDPARRFQEDYLRIPRALRFAARFGFTVEPGTWEAAKSQVSGLTHLSAERVREEWFKGLQTSQQPSRLLALWAEVGALGVWLPEVGSVEQGAVDARGPVLDRFAPRDPVLMTSFLSTAPAETLSRLKCSSAEIERGRRIGEFRHVAADPESPLSVRRWLHAVGLAADDLLTILEAQGQGSRLGLAVEAVRASHAPLTIGDLALDGEDLKRLGVPQGPQVGEILRALLDRALEDPSLNTQARLTALAKDILADPTVHRSPFTLHPSPFTPPDSEAPPPRSP